MTSNARTSPETTATPQTRRVWFHTFGCQMNEYDTGKMRAKLAGRGWEKAEDPSEADLVLLNTCSI